MQGPALSLALLLSGAAFAEPEPQASADVQRVADWVLSSKDNQRRPYVIIDKVNARVFVYDAAGVLKGADSALLGMARGDRVSARKPAVPGPKERVTPAGRFLANLDHDAYGKQVLLIDYDNSIALHAVVKGTPAERRAERLASATPGDNRISFGCVNVPVAFFRDVVSTAFARTDGYVYILPEAPDATPMFGPTAASP